MAVFSRVCGRKECHHGGATHAARAVRLPTVRRLLRRGLPARRGAARPRHLPGGRAHAHGPRVPGRGSGGVATRSSSSRASPSTLTARTAPAATGRSPSTSCRGSSRPTSGDQIKRGLAQRIRALNAFVDDVYHGREIVREGIVPWELVVGSPHFAAPCTASARRAASTATSPAATSSATAMAPGACSRTTCRTPSGISYVLENRLAMTRLLPELFHHYRVRAVDHYPQLLLAALRAVAPAAEARGDGRRLDARARRTPRTSSTRSSRARWASSWSRRATSSCATTSSTCARPSGLQRVHAIYRRLDDDFIDPLEFRPDSAARRARAVRAYRAGTVALANAVGTGVADDKADLPLRARDDPLLPRRGAAAATTCRPTCCRPDQREHVLARLRRARGQADGRVAAARASSSGR